MSDLDNAINSINASAAKAENTATFLDDMSTFDDQSSVTNPNNGQTVASIPKQVKDRTDELFTAAESDINQAVSDAAQSATDAQDAADSIGRYQGLWPDTGGYADKGDTYQTQVSGTPTGQYFAALQDTTVDPVGDDVNWRAVVSFSSISGENLISNAFFEFAGSVTNPPDATPRDYVAGDELFSGIFAVGTLTDVTYTDGKLSGSGQLFVDVYKSEKQKLSTTPHVASIASSDGVPVKSGASFVDNGDYWRVTFDMSDTFSVKFEQGSVATGHESKSLFDLYGDPNITGVVDPKQFGAVGDGVSDDSDAVEMALLVLGYGSYGKVFNLTSGRYRISRDLSYLSTNESFERRVFNFNGSEIVSDSKVKLQIEGKHHEINNMKLSENVDFYTEFLWDSMLNNCWFYDVYLKPKVGYGIYWNTLNQSYIEKITYDLTVNNANANSFFGGHVGEIVKIGDGDCYANMFQGVDITKNVTWDSIDFHPLVLDNCTIEGSSLSPVVLDGNIIIKNTRGINSGSNGRYLQSQTTQDVEFYDFQGSAYERFRPESYINHKLGVLTPSGFSNITTNPASIPVLISSDNFGVSADYSIDSNSGSLRVNLTDNEMQIANSVGQCTIGFWMDVNGIEGISLIRVINGSAEYPDMSYWKTDGVHFVTLTFRKPAGEDITSAYLEFLLSGTTQSGNIKIYQQISSAGKISDFGSSRVNSTGCNVVTIPATPTGNDSAYTIDTIVMTSKTSPVIRKYRVSHQILGSGDAISQFEVEVSAGYKGGSYAASIIKGPIPLEPADTNGQAVSATTSVSGSSIDVIINFKGLASIAGAATVELLNK